MNRKLLLIPILIILLAFSLSACGGSYYTPSSWPGLAANDQYIFLAYSTYVHAINPETGEEAWRYPEKASNATTFFSNPVLTDDGQLLVASYDHKLYSLDPQNGSENWIFTNATDRLIASPLVTAEGIFQASADGSIYALGYNGVQQWSYKTDGPIWASPVADDSCTCLYLASMDHHVYAVDASTGELIWKSATLNGAMVGSPAYDPAGQVIVGTFGSEVVALDAETGTENWRYDTEGWVWSGGVILDDAIYLGDLDGFVYSLNLTNGRQNWRIQPGGPIIGSPLLTDGQLYISTENDTVYQVSLDGNVIDSFVVGGTLYASPYKAGDLILIAPLNSDILLAALTSTGAQQWTFTPAK
jgi:outer membrane protein assembly factor BamB